MLKGVPGIYIGMTLFFPYLGLVLESPSCPSEQNLNVSPFCLLLLGFPALKYPLAGFSWTQHKSQLRSNTDRVQCVSIDPATLPCLQELWICKTPGKDIVLLRRPFSLRMRTWLLLLQVRQSWLKAYTLQCMAQKIPKQLSSALVLYKAVQYEKQKYITGLLLSHPEKCLFVMFQMGAHC